MTYQAGMTPGGPGGSPYSPIPTAQVPTTQVADSAVAANGADYLGSMRVLKRGRGGRPEMVVISGGLTSAVERVADELMSGGVKVTYHDPNNPNDLFSPSPGHAQITGSGIGLYFSPYKKEGEVLAVIGKGTPRIYDALNALVTRTASNQGGKGLPNQGRNNLESMVVKP